MIAKFLSLDRVRSVAIALLLVLVIPAVGIEPNDLYQSGVDAFADKLFDLSAQFFEELVEQHRDSLLRADATFLLALSYYHIGQHEQSLERLETFAGRFSESEHVAVVDHWRAANLLAMGKAAELAGRIDDAAALMVEAEVFAVRQLANTEAPEIYSSRTRLLHAAVLFQLGHISYRGGRYRTAVEAFERVLGYDESPWAPHALFALAEAALAVGDLAEAVDRLLLYLELFPNGNLAPRAEERLPFVYLAMDRFRDAMETAELALRSAVTAELKARLFQIQGEAALRLNDIQGALIALNAALDTGLDPIGEQRASYHLALAYLRDGRRSLAIGALQRASNGPDNELSADALLNYAYLLIEDGQLVAGAKSLHWFTESYPDHVRLPEALQILARTREALGETEAALNSWERLSFLLQTRGISEKVTIGSVHAVPVSMLIGAADAAASIEQDDLALLLLARLRSTAGVSTAEWMEAVYRIGRIYGARGEHMRAAGFYREVVLAAPRPSEIAARSRIALGAELFNAGEYREAISYLLDDGGIWDQYRRLALGRVYYRLGESDKAVNVLQDALFAPDEEVAAEALYLYAAAFFQGGMFESALNNYLQFADQFPNSVRTPSAIYRAAISQLRLKRPQMATDLFVSALSKIEILESQGQGNSAFDSLKNNSEEFDLVQEIWFMLVDIALEANRVEEAASALRKLRSRSRMGLLAAEAGLKYGNYLVVHGSPEMGLNTFRQVALDNEGASVGMRALLAAGQVAEDLGHHSDAADSYWDILIADHDTGLSDQALEGFSNSFFSIGVVGAESYYIAAKEDEGTNLSPYVRARVLHDYALLIYSGQPETAAMILELALPDMLPGTDRDAAYFLLASIYRETGELHLAADAYQIVASVSVPGGGRQAEAELCRALILAKSNRRAMTANILANVALRHPLENEVASEALYRAVEIMYSEGAERSAARLGDRLLQHYPGSAWAALLSDWRRQTPASVCS